jgi:hypothetical protein
VILLFLFNNKAFIYGREKPEPNLPNLNNPIPIYPPDRFYLLNDRLYLKYEYTLYRYNMSDKENINYMNHIFLETNADYVSYFEDELITINNKINYRNQKSTLTIITYDISNDKFTLLNTIEMAKQPRIEELKVLNNYLLFFSYYQQLNYRPLNGSEIYTIPAEIIDYNNNYLNIETLLLENNLLYLVTQERETNLANLVIVDMSELSNPVLVGNCTFEDKSCFNPSIKKVNDILYLETRDSILYAFNVSNSLAPSFKGDFNVSGYESGIKVCGNFAVATIDDYPSNRLEIYNITSFDSIILLDSYNLTEYWIAYMYVFQDVIFLSQTSDFLIFDWSNQTNITYLTLINPPYFKKIGFNPFWMFPSILLFFYCIQKRKKRKN